MGLFPLCCSSAVQASRLKVSSKTYIKLKNHKQTLKQQAFIYLQIIRQPVFEI